MAIGRSAKLTNTQADFGYGRRISFLRCRTRTSRRRSARMQHVSRQHVSINGSTTLGTGAVFLVVTCRHGRESATKLPRRRLVWVLMLSIRTVQSLTYMPSESRKRCAAHHPILPINPIVAPRRHRMCIYTKPPTEWSAGACLTSESWFGRPPGTACLFTGMRYGKDLQH